MVANRAENAVLHEFFHQLERIQKKRQFFAMQFLVADWKSLGKP